MLVDAGPGFFYLFIDVEEDLATGQSRFSIPGADFTKGLKSRFRLKFKTLVLNFVKRMLSLWS